MSEQSLEERIRKPAGHVDAGDAGYSKSLKSRHVNMTAIGSAIGTDLFLGADGRLADAGPSLFIAYAVCGVFAFPVVRALGELVRDRPSSGAFVSYAGRRTVLCLPLIAAGLIAGWYGVRGRVAAVRKSEVEA